MNLLLALILFLIPLTVEPPPDYCTYRLDLPVRVDTLFVVENCASAQIWTMTWHRPDCDAYHMAEFRGCWTWPNQPAEPGRESCMIEIKAVVDVRDQGGDLFRVAELERFCSALEMPRVVLVERGYATYLPRIEQ